MYVHACAILYIKFARMKCVRLCCEMNYVQFIYIEKELNLLRILSHQEMKK